MRILEVRARHVARHWSATNFVRPVFLTGLEQQIQEIKESVELPLTHPELYEEMGIKPPKGESAPPSDQRKVSY